MIYISMSVCPIRCLDPMKQMELRILAEKISRNLIYVRQVLQSTLLLLM